MVLLHGITNSWRIWLPVLPALESEHDVLALTLAGHYGAAPLPAGVTASVSALTDAAERALDQTGFDTAHLVGNSLGGWVAFELAKRGRATSVVAFSPAGGQPRTSPEEARRVARKIDLGFRLARVLSPVAGPLTRFPIGRRALFSQLAAHPERIPPQEAAYRLRALAGCTVLPGLLASIVGARAERLDEIRCPVLLVWPTGDRLLPKAQFAPSLLSAMPEVRLLEPPDIGHMPMYDDPDLIAQIILDFARAHALKLAPRST
jgi:pimeloyl-ACP methyl ester carboxylesterase